MKRFCKDALFACGVFVASIVSFLWDLPVALSLNLEKKDRIEKDNCGVGGDRG